MPGWSDYGFDQPRLKPLSLLFEGLMRAYNERCAVLDLPNWYDTDIWGWRFPCLQRTPGEIVNGLLENLCARECLEATFSTAERLPYYQQADEWYAPWPGKWFEFAQEAYFARMQALFGFDIRKGVPPLRPLDADLFRALRTAVGGLRYKYDYEAEYTFHGRAVDDGVLGEWKKYTTWLQGELYLGSWYQPDIDPESGVDYGDGGQAWMFEDDIIYVPLAALEYQAYLFGPISYMTVDGYIMKCIQNDLGDILPGYSAGKYYAHLGETWNPAEGVAAPALSRQEHNRYCQFTFPLPIFDCNSLFEFQADDPEG